MYYNTTADLPTTLRETLPPKAQEIYLTTYNLAWDDYSEKDESDRARLAHQLAWDAVNRDFTFVEGEGGKGGAWYPAGEEPVEEEQEQKRGILGRLGLR